MSRSYIDVSAELDQACPVVEILDDVGGKWSIGVLVVAARGPVRFTELERAIPGVSRRMLTLTLRKLERDGLLIRTIYPTVPPKVEYALTDAGRESQSSLTALPEWSIRHRATITAARNAYDRN